jgi:hypothetical protein
MPPAGFEPAIPACQRPQTKALGRAALIFIKVLEINRILE